jgi:tripartite-type tricarboxylate transporter receptor subunit TctC
MALPFMAPPGVPADRAAALREAFALMMADDDFLADARNQRLDITPVSGEAVHALIADLAATPRDAVAQFNAITMPERN